MRLIGHHINATMGGIPEFIAGAKPAAVVVLDGNKDWGWVVDNLKETKMVWRGFRPDEPNFEEPMDPKAEAKSYVEWSLAKMEGVKWDYVIGPNEPIISTVKGMEQLAEFEIERARLLRLRGYGAAVGTFAVGNPADMSLLDYFIPAIEAIHEYEGVLSLHEYGPPEDLKKDADWLILRHRKFYDGEPSQGWEGLPLRLKDTPLIITETGGDQLIYTTTPGGWQWHMSEAEYITALNWLDDELMKDSYVLGSAIFCCGNIAPQWISYDVWEHTAKMISAQRIPVYRTPEYDDGTLPIPPQDEEVNGVDVSYWQDRVNWEAAKAGGVDFAIPRSSFRMSFDSKFVMHYEGARNAGLPVGMYHYLYGDASPAEQAHFFSSWVHKFNPDLPPALDVEDSSIRQSQVQVFVETFRVINSRELMIYTSRSKWHSLVGLGATWAEDCPLWVADWGDVGEPRLPDIWDTWEFWQYTSKGSIPGYDKRVDMNRFNGDHTLFLARYGAVDIVC